MHNSLKPAIDSHASCDLLTTLMSAVIECFLVALRLGLTSFGGPVAHVSYFREEYVGRRRVDYRVPLRRNHVAYTIHSRPRKQPTRRGHRL